VSIDEHGRDPSIDQSVAALQYLLWVWHARDGMVALPEVGGSTLLGTALHVQVEHAVELTEAVIELLRNNIYLSTAPLIRLSMECAVTAAWWATNPKGVLASVHEAVRQTERRVAEGRKGQPGPFVDDPHIADTIAETAEFASNTARDFRERCEAIKGGSWIYAYYKLLSEMSHSGPNLMFEYAPVVEVDARHPDGLAFTQRPHYENLDLALWLQVRMLTLAIASWDAISPAHPDERALHDLADSLDFGEFIREATGR
jgi:hypothetical protein